MTARILLTGASGFIGKHCLDYLLSQNHDVVCLGRTKRQVDNDKIKWISCDILENKALERVMAEIGADYLIHCAWYVEHQKFWNSPLNVDYIFATIELWKLFVKNNGKKAIFLGSCAEVKSSLQDDGSIYGKSKLITANLITLLNQCYPSQASFVWGRIFGLYGPGENLMRIVPYLLQAYMSNVAPEIKTPHVVYDFVYVKNLAKLIVDELFSENKGIFDLGMNNIFSIKDLANYIHLKFFPKAAPALIYPNNNESHFIPDLSNRTLDLGKFMSFDDSITEYLTYLKKYSGAYHA